MIQNFKSFNNMKTKHSLTAVGIILLAVGLLIGLGYYLVRTEEKEPTGYYTAQDTLKSYNRGYQDGSYNMRQIIKCERTDTTIKSCQDK